MFGDAIPFYLKITMNLIGMFLFLLATRNLDIAMKIEKENSTEIEPNNELRLRFQEELMHREEMSERNLQEEYNHLRHLSEYELFWKISVRDAKKNREEWLVDMYNEVYSEWVIYLVEHQAAKDDYLGAMSLVLLGIPMTHSQAVSAWHKLKDAGFNGVICELADGVFKVRLEGMSLSKDMIRSFTPDE